MGQSFDIPSHPHNSTFGARQAYRKIWNREWPHDDAYLRLLAREVPQYHSTNKGFSRCEFLLTLMREDHPFDDKRATEDAVRRWKASNV